MILCSRVRTKNSSADSKLIGFLFWLSFNDVVLVKSFVPKQHFNVIIRFGRHSGFRGGKAKIESRFKRRIAKYQSFEDIILDYELTLNAYYTIREKRKN